MTKRAETEELIAVFQMYLETDGKGPATIESYVGDVAGFIYYSST